MENNENFDMVAAVKQLVEDYGHLADEIAEVKKSIYDNLINPIQQEYEQMKYDDELSDFRCKYAEKLEPFNDKLKVLEKDENFDIVKNAFDDFSKREDGMEADTYVDALADKIQKQLDDIAAVFGIEKEEIEEVKVETEDGDVKAEVEDGEVTEVEKETETEVETDETDKAESTEETETENEATETEEVETEEVPAEEEEEEKESTADKLNKFLGKE